MTNLTLTAVLQASILAATSGGATGSLAAVDDYASARAKIEKTGQPIVILVGADWCPACVAMKKDVMPEIRKQGILKQVAYATVNLDKQGKLGRQLTDGGPIPQMIMYRKTRRGWLRKRLIGGQSPKTIVSFIRRGVELDFAAKKSAAKKAKAASKPSPETRQAHSDKVASKEAI